MAIIQDSLCQLANPGHNRTILLEQSLDKIYQISLPSAQTKNAAVLAEGN